MPLQLSFHCQKKPSRGAKCDWSVSFLSGTSQVYTLSLNARTWNVFWKMHIISILGSLKMLLVNFPKNTLHMFHTMPSWLHGTAQDQNHHVQYVIYVHPHCPAIRTSSSWKWRQFSASYWALFLTLFMVNGLSVALLMRSLVVCNQVLSELRRVHFTGSQGTGSNQNVVFPPFCNNTFDHYGADIQS